jgi:hypothetical protein
MAVGATFAERKATMAVGATFAERKATMAVGATFAKGDNGCGRYFRGAKGDNGCGRYFRGAKGDNGGAKGATTKESTPDRIRTCNPRFRRSGEPSSANADIPVSVMVRQCHRDGPDRLAEGRGVVPGRARLRLQEHVWDGSLLSILLSTPFEWHTITPFCTTQQQASERSVRAGLRPLRWGSSGMLPGNAIIAGVVIASQG